MSSRGEVLEVIEEYRARLLTAQGGPEAELTPEFAAAGLRNLTGQLASPLGNIHATGIGLKVTNNAIVPNEYAIKVYVFVKKNGIDNILPALTREKFNGVDIDVEELPTLMINPPGSGNASASSQQNRRTIPGGVQIQPRGQSYVGTLGGFVKDNLDGTIYALSNNHVLANSNKLARDHPIHHPSVAQNDRHFAKLETYVPILFEGKQQTNTMDAAIARVEGTGRPKLGSILGVSNYKPQIQAAVAGMTVTKVGARTNKTNGIVLDENVQGIQVNFGTQNSPKLARFDDCMLIRSSNSSPFSLGGDSGSFVLSTNSGCPVGLLFAGNGYTTIACHMQNVCHQLDVTPV